VVGIGGAGFIRRGHGGVGQEAQDLEIHISEWFTTQKVLAHDLPEPFVLTAVER